MQIVLTQTRKWPTIIGPAENLSFGRAPLGSYWRCPVYNHGSPGLPHLEKPCNARILQFRATEIHFLRMLSVAFWPTRSHGSPQT
jgi:hypothetical protein